MCRVIMKTISIALGEPQGHPPKALLTLLSHRQNKKSFHRSKDYLVTLLPKQLCLNILVKYLFIIHVRQQSNGKNITINQSKFDINLNMKVLQALIFFA